MQARLFIAIAAAALSTACTDGPATPTAPVVAFGPPRAHFETGAFGRQVIQFTQPGTFGTIFVFHQSVTSGPVSPGPYTMTSVATDATTIAWPGDRYYWSISNTSNSTLYRFRFGSLTWGRRNSTCNWTRTSTSPGPFSTVENGCAANFVQSSYTIEKVRDEFPVAASVTGAATVSTGINGYYATASGGDGTYTYAWYKSTDGGASWTPVCDASTFCAQYTVLGDPSFILRFDATSWVHTDNAGHFQQVTASARISVTVTAGTLPLAPPDDPGGPSYDPNCTQFIGCTP